MGKVKYGTDMDLELVTSNWLMKDGFLQKQMDKAFEYEAIIEVPLELAKQVQVDIMAVVEEDIDDYNLWDYDTVNAEQYLVRGKVLEVGGNVIYKQG